MGSTVPSGSLPLLPDRYGYAGTDEIKIDFARGCVSRQGSEFFLRHQSLQVLICLLQDHGHLVSKDSLNNKIWQNTAVTDNALAQCIAEIRKALGDGSRNPRYIRTIAKSGYCFIAPVLETSQTQPQTQHDPFVSQSDSDPGPNEPVLLAFPTARANDTASRPPALQTTSRSLRSLTPFSWKLIAAGVLILVAAICSIKWHLHVIAAEATMGPLNDHNLAVMYFENESSRDDLNWLRQGLTDMMITDMSRSGTLHVLSRQQLSTLLPAGDDKNNAAVSFEQALHVAQVAHAAKVLTGSFSAIDGNIRIDIQLHDAASGQISFADHIIFPRNADLLSQIDILAGRLGNALDGSASARPNLSEVTTTNVEAYRYYSLGVEKAQQLENSEAIELLKQAARFDPQFAMAWARIGYAYAVTDFAPEKGRPYLEKALELSSHLTAKDSLYVHAWYAISRSDFQQATDTFRELIHRYPQETEAYWRLAKLLRGTEQSEEALKVLHQGLIVNPNDPILYNVEGVVLLGMHRYSEAIEAYRQYINAEPNSPNSHDSLGMAWEQSGNYDAAISEYNQALALNPIFEPAIIHLGDVYYQIGRFKDAAYQYQRYVGVAQTSNARALGYGNLAMVYLAMNDIPKARQAAANELHDNPHAVWSSREIAIRMGNTEAASRYEQHLLDGIPTQERGMQGDQRTRYYYQGSIALSHNKNDEALAAFRTALTHLPPTSGIDLYEDCLANAELRLGHYREAIAEYDRILAFNPNYPLAHYHIAEAYAHLGDKQHAQSEYHDFLQDWRTADTIPPVS